MFQEPADVVDALIRQNYISSTKVGTVLYMAEKLGKPVLAEGPAGEAALGAWAANVRGIVAKANAIVANSVFFIFFFSLRAHRPLTFPSCARLTLNSIAPAGYRRRRNWGYGG